MRYPFYAWGVVGVLFLLDIVAASQHTVPRACAAGTAGLDYHTLYDTHTFAPSPALCCSNCTALATCNAWSWAPFADHSGRGNCWLTLSPNGPRPGAVQGAVSGKIPGRPSPPPPAPMPANGPCGMIPLPSVPPPAEIGRSSFQRNVRDPSQPPNCTWAVPWQDLNGGYIDAHGAGLALRPERLPPSVGA